MLAIATPPTVKVIGANGQISLGKQFAGRQVLVEEQEAGVWLIRTATVIPDNERRLHDAQATANLTQAVESQHATDNARIEYVFDSIAYDARQAEIAKLMTRVREKRCSLAKWIASGMVDTKDARLRNASMPGILGELWGKFIELPNLEQIKALEQSDFNGMSWQSLLQCSPYFKNS